MKKLLLYITITMSLFAEDVMVERMQSIVDEVTQLRVSYENSEKKVQECEERVSKQEDVVQKLSRSQGMDYKDFEKSRDKLKKLQTENKTLKNHKKEIATLEKENQRLKSSARILVDKNQELLKQVNKSKSANVEALEVELKTTRELLALKKAQNSKLQKELKANKSVKTEKVLKQKSCQKCPDIKVCKKCPEITPCVKAVGCKKVKATTVTKVIKSCEDDNPFPALMPKDGKTVNPHPIELDKLVKVQKVSTLVKKMVVVKPVESKQIVTKKASTYRMKSESAVYDNINGNVVEIWEEKTSFTSNVTQGEWVKITGFFVNKKWQRAQKGLWVRLDNTIKR